MVGVHMSSQDNWASVHAQGSNLCRKDRNSMGGGRIAPIHKNGDTAGKLEEGRVSLADIQNGDTKMV
jgi:hypothetical protein